MRILKGVLAALLVCISPYARAKDRLYEIGQGEVSCGAWLKQRENTIVHRQQLEWVLGFVTGSNYRTESQGTPADSAAVDVFIDEYWQHNTLHRVFDAAAALVQESGGPSALPEK